MTIKQASEQRWRVMRLDDNRSQFVVARDMNEIEARALVTQLAGRGNKHEYRVELMPALRARTS